MAESIEDSDDRNPFWYARRMLRMLSPTAHDRCRLCLAGFDGFTAPAMRVMGRAPWRRNPHFCEKCEAVLAKERGGAEIDIAMLYADVRGSTQLAARVGPTKFAALMQRFFQAATAVFTDSDAVVDKMVGDEVIGVYVPGLTGFDYRQRAVRAGLDLLHTTGHADPQGAWLPIGVGVHAGKTFVGSIGVEGGNYQFAALGDPMNYCARLVAAAKDGELVISEALWKDASGVVAAEQRSLTLKGYSDPARAYVTRVTSE